MCKVQHVGGGWEEPRRVNDPAAVAAAAAELICVDRWPRGNRQWWFGPQCRPFCQISVHSTVPQTQDRRRHVSCLQFELWNIRWLYATVLQKNYHITGMHVCAIEYRSAQYISHMLTALHMLLANLTASFQFSSMWSVSQTEIPALDILLLNQVR